MKDPVAAISQITHPDEGPCPLCSYIFDTHKDGCPYEAIDAALAASSSLVDKVGCAFAGPGRGDCEHFVGLPGKSIPGQHDGPDDTVDVYGKSNGWCWWCWHTHLLTANPFQEGLRKALVLTEKYVIRNKAGEYWQCRSDGDFAWGKLGDATLCDWDSHPEKDDESFERVIVWIALTRASRSATAGGSQECTCVNYFTSVTCPVHGGSQEVKT